MGMLLLKRDTGGYLECLGTATSTKLCWGYRSTAGGGSIVPHSPLTLSTITYCVQKYLQNVCRAETLFRISDRSHWQVCGPGMGWGELGWGGNRRFPTTSTGGGGSWASTRSFPSKLVGGNSRLPYKSFPFRTLLAYCCLLKSGK